MIINISDVWARAAADHLRFLQPLLWNAVRELESVHGAESVERRTAAFLQANIRGLTSLISSDIPPVIASFDAMFALGSPMRDRAMEIISHLIDYDGFSDKANWGRRPWHAYSLCAKADYVVCPYCHITSTVTKLPDPVTNKGIRPDLDHFYPKSRFPYLALTLANLIPCCAQCNRQCKGVIDFVAQPHLNPLQHQESVRFRLQLIPALAARGDYLGQEKPDHFEIKLEPFGPHKAPAAASMRTFCLPERYAPFLREMFAFRSSVRTQRARLRMYAEEIPGLAVTPDDGLPFERHEYKKVLGGKLRLDVFDALQAEVL